MQWARAKLFVRTYRVRWKSKGHVHVTRIADARLPLAKRERHARLEGRGALRSQWWYFVQLAVLFRRAVDKLLQHRMVCHSSCHRLRTASNRRPAPIQPSVMRQIVKVFASICAAVACTARSVPWHSSTVHRRIGRGRRSVDPKSSAAAHSNCRDR